MDDQSRRDEHSSQDEQPGQRRRLGAYAAIDLEPLKNAKDLGKTVLLRKRREGKEDSGNNGHSAGSVGSAKGASRNSWEGNSRPASTTSIGSNASGGLAKRDSRLDDLPEDPECSSKYQKEKTSESGVNLELRPNPLKVKVNAAQDITESLEKELWENEDHAPTNFLQQGNLNDQSYHPHLNHPTEITEIALHPDDGLTVATFNSDETKLYHLDSESKCQENTTSHALKNSEPDDCQNKNDKLAFSSPCPSKQSLPSHWPYVQHFNDSCDRSCDSSDEEASKPISAQDIFGSSCELVLRNSSALFEELKHNKAFLEKYTKCKLVRLKIPTSYLISGECDYQSAPFLVKESEDSGYAVQAYLPTTDGYLGVAIGILKGNSDDLVPWPFDKVVIFRIENSETLKALDIGLCCEKCDIMGCITRPSDNNNDCMGLSNFIVREDLKEYATPGSYVMIYCLVLPQEATSIPNVALEIPSKISTCCKESTETPGQQQEIPDCSQSHRHGDTFSTLQPISEEQSSHSNMAAPNIPELQVSFHECERDSEIIQLYSGVTLIILAISEVHSKLKSGISNFFEKDIKVRTSTKHKLEYSLKIVFQLENSALSAGIALRKDQHDDLLDWPFTKSIAFQLVNKDPEKHFDQGFRCSKADENIADCLGCPSSGSHPPIGLRDFISVEHLNNGFIVADTLHARMLVIPEEYEMPSCGLLSVLN